MGEPEKTGEVINKSAAATSAERRKPRIPDNIVHPENNDKNGGDYNVREKAFVFWNAKMWSLRQFFFGGSIPDVRS